MSSARELLKQARLQRNGTNTRKRADRFQSATPKRVKKQETEAPRDKNQNEPLLKDKTEDHSLREEDKGTPILPVDFFDKTSTGNNTAIDEEWSNFEKDIAEVTSKQTEAKDLAQRENELIRQLKEEKLLDSNNEYSTPSMNKQEPDDTIHDLDLFYEEESYMTTLRDRLEKLKNFRPKDNTLNAVNDETNITNVDALMNVEESASEDEDDWRRR
ncbi:mediator complex subunit Med9 [Schizosaccharomyces japonicus yFS275]|uniref:Mediator complex subunit Med9 n=1 Tax=Schizosaccharomyces japonicus (strain yFS275 / FY16936) TaxID=402676 RepID=B6JYP1_SCHJY|nr:mediator complex subunit Med9 [Schizosaccharomyces japonicus yFS275]EEB06659.1 mediator complex subunit Med9 [Schizosaccharomyces japonicus yFS275]